MEKKETRYLPKLTSWLEKERWSLHEAAMVWAGIDPDSCRWIENDGPSIINGARLFTGEHIKTNKFTERPPVDKSVPGNEAAATHFHDHLLFGFSFNDIYDPRNPPFKWASPKEGEEYLARAKKWQDDTDKINIACKSASRIYADLRCVCKFTQMPVEDVFETMFSAKYPPPWLNFAEHNDLLKRYERVNKFHQLEHFQCKENAEGSTEKSRFGDSTVCPPVPQERIIKNFRVIADEEENKKWWKDRLSEAKRYSGLIDCRAGSGKRGAGGSLWRPHLMAVWLLGQISNRRIKVSPTMIRSALLKFQGGDKAVELIQEYEFEQCWEST